ncbi:MAG: G4 quadruplex nucleic acid binding protein [Chaenotheca gracillima]|nr:MAG: G4 quadruplex nucleic acid binding protein [Chaenotheca gracillima]
MASAPLDSGAPVGVPIRSSSSAFNAANKLQVSSSLFPAITYSDVERSEITRWQEVSDSIADAKHEDAVFRTLNEHLSTRTTLLGSKPSAADLQLSSCVLPAVAHWTPEQRTGESGYHHIVRWADFVQNSPIFSEGAGGQDKVFIDANDVRFIPKPVDPKEEKERKKKEKAAAAAASDGKAIPEKDSSPAESAAGAKSAQAKTDVSNNAQGQEKEGVAGPLAGSVSTSGKKATKKEKQPKPQKAPAKETPLTPSLIDLRVGHIIKAVNHPNADSLYVSTIACGDAPGSDNTSDHEGTVVRTVCSGLNGLVPLEEMQGRKVIVVCNLKPVTMRGIKSAAMVLAASPRPVEGQEADPHKGPVELVSPPADAQPGERVFFEGWEGEPEGVLNPKKKVWESCQVGFTTTAEREVAFDSSVVTGLAGSDAEGKSSKGLGKLKTQAGQLCLVKSLEGATVR